MNIGGSLPLSIIFFHIEDENFFIADFLLEDVFFELLSELLLELLSELLLELLSELLLELLLQDESLSLSVSNCPENPHLRPPPPLWGEHERERERLRPRLSL
jgi:hypothetical protein